MPWARIKRWLYGERRPGAIARFLNRGFASLHARGLGPESWVTLEVVGRKSGRPISFPLVMASVDGERYLVSMLGPDAAWVRNVRAASGHAVLRRGGAEPVRLEEVPVERRALILQDYLRRAPGARPHLPVHKDATLAEFEAVAARVPVFRVMRA
jgi:deazaflavin-dependent oxidoreductase (nitroreductase family)